MVVTLLPVLLLLSAPDAGVADGLPRSAEHRALQTQVALMRQEVKRPRDWFDRDRGERLKAELATIERVLQEVDEMYGVRLARCQQMWRGIKDDRWGTVHPGYYACPEKAVVPDVLVRQVRRKHEVQRRLQDKGIPVPTRTALRRELDELNAELDKESGMEPLYVQPIEAPDAGPAGETPHVEAPSIVAP